MSTSSNRNSTPTNSTSSRQRQYQYRSRSDSIPEHYPVVPDVTTNSANTPITTTTNDDDEIDALLLRHSSPLSITRTAGSATSPSLVGQTRATADSGSSGSSRTVSPLHLLQQQQQHQQQNGPILIRRNSNSSPSPLRLNRPRSNPRNRTPMRYQDNEEDHHAGEQHQQQHEDEGVGENDNFIASLLAQATNVRRTNSSDDDNDDEIDDNVRRNEGQRITIRPQAGAAVGAHVGAANRFRTHTDHNRRSNDTTTGQSSGPTKSRKQGPGKRKIRRANNSNFVNLAMEVHGSSTNAAKALLVGHTNASKHRSLVDKRDRPSTMEEFYTNSNSKTKEKFFDGELPQRSVMYELNPSTNSKSNKTKPISMLTPLERYYRIDRRLRNILTKACVNSFAASNVVKTFESYLICEVYNCHNGKPGCQNKSMTMEDWAELGVIEPPTISEMVTPNRNKDDTVVDDDDDDQAEYVVVNTQHQKASSTKNLDTDANTTGTMLQIRFLFDGNPSSTSAFHRLLLHSVAQFYGLTAVPSTIETGRDGGGKKSARVLTITGRTPPTATIMDQTLVDFVVALQQGTTPESQISSTSSNQQLQ